MKTGPEQQKERVRAAWRGHEGKDREAFKN